MRLQQLFIRLATLGPERWAAARLADVFTRHSFGPHRFNERVLATYFDDLADRTFGARAAPGLRYTLLATGLCLRSARAPVLAINASGEHVLERIFERTGGLPQAEGVLRAVGEARKGLRELSLTALEEEPPQADTWILDLCSTDAAMDEALARALEKLLGRPHWAALAFSNASEASALESALGRIRARGSGPVAASYHELAPLPVHDDASQALRIELLHG